MEAGGALAPVLLAAFSLPCVLLLLLALGKAALRVAAAAAALRGGRARGGHAHAWPTLPGGVSAYHPASVFRDDDDEPPLPPECCDRLAVAAYRRGQRGRPGGPDPECVFCLSAVGDGEEVRELRCRHVLHRACLDAWLVRPRATCPLCRDPLLPADTPRPVCSADATSYGFDFGVPGGGDLSSSVHAHGGALWHMT
ncbi:E3 ubiquitin-protein ligase EL5-like [Panicum miliaceum]|uniref:E3 ubiquitin-protein ligase EL5-like n=1 Tax=Panicum miliaceum TaxID=4540 RepID=A0A3L6SLF7_PANMI|nr:E3 ubiquitin-protein ligase EL5-like [Panicum miliaceum]